MHEAKHIPIMVQGRRHTPGFSLIELVLVLTIISILSAIAVPRYANALARYRADAAARRVVADLDYARQRARSTSASVTVHFLLNDDILHLQAVPSQDDPAVEWMTQLGARPYHADLVSADFGGDFMITFDGYGDPDSGGTAQLSVGSESRTVVLDPDTGKAVVQ